MLLQMHGSVLKYTRDLTRIFNSRIPEQNKLIKSMVTIKLKKGKEDSLLRHHPWIFSGAIHSATGEVEDGDIVRVESSDGNFLAIGHSSIGSIAVRVLSFTDEEIDLNWWAKRINSALSVRKASGLPSKETNAYRLVHGEGDSLPGLVVDIYDKVAVIQCHSTGMYLCRKYIQEAICMVLGNSIDAVYDKSKGTLPQTSGIEPKDGYLFQRQGVVIATNMTENGHEFMANWLGGQKTGFFLDQRDNRQLLSKYAKGKRVLNTFCYTGGFSVYALAAGATYCESVDSSEKAVQLAHDNIELNGFDKKSHKETVSDTMDLLAGIDEGDFDLIILDPPAYAKHQSAISNALQGYKRLNARAMSKLKPGSLLFTFSCSQAVSSEKFQEAIFSAAKIAKRQVRILHRMTQGADHPVNIYHPEGQYLKGLVLFIE